LSGHLTTFETPLQRIVLKEILEEGLIVDIGGGGEGFVSRVAGERVCAVDNRIHEIIEARIHDPPASWIVSDGRALCFQDGVFAVATLWFSFGFMPEWNTKRDVVTEINRVLHQNGLLDIHFMHIGDESDIFVFRGSFTLPDGIDSLMGYRVNGGQNQYPETIIRLLEESGFQIIDYDSHEYWSRLVARKMDSPKP